MDHDWRESYTADLMNVIFMCLVCKRRLVIRKQDCVYHSPSEDEELLEKHGIDPDCNVEQVRLVMES